MYPNEQPEQTNEKRDLAHQFFIWANELVIPDRFHKLEEYANELRPNEYEQLRESYINGLIAPMEYYGQLADIVKWS